MLPLQKFTEEEFSEMPSCNLAETVHNKWLQASGNNGHDMYVATVDDFVRVFLKVINFYQFLKDDVGGTGPSKKELKLRNAERRAKQTVNPILLEDAMLEMPGAHEFCIRLPHMAGEEVFGSVKRKADLPIGAEEESHRPDKVKYSRPKGSGRVVRARTMPMPVIVEDDTKDETEVVEIQPTAAISQDTPSSPINEKGVRHVNVVEETKVNVKEWHISRLLKSSAKCCWAERAVTKKKCTEKIVRGANSTTAPTYTGVWTNVRKNTSERIQFFFYSNDIERCVKGTRRKRVAKYSRDQEMPPIPEV